MAKRENPMSVRSKKALAQSLLRLMEHRPYQEICISDVTENAGLARQTFYSNFSTKEDILTYLLDGLFQKYRAQLARTKNDPEHLLLDYFLFWNKVRDFISLLMRHRLGHLFQERNRDLFRQETFPVPTSLPDEFLESSYINAALAGITYELLWLWLMQDQGLNIDMLSALAKNLLSGRVFTDEEIFTKSSLEKTG